MVLTKKIVIRSNVSPVKHIFTQSFAIYYLLFPVDAYFRICLHSN